MITNMTWYSLASDSTPHISQCIATAALMAGAMQVGPLKFTLARAVEYACNAAAAPAHFVTKNCGKLAAAAPSQRG